MPDTVAESSLGTAYVANGVDRVLRWDGFAPEAQNAGLDRPAAAPTVSATSPVSASDDDVDYYAFVRYVDAEGSYSSLSPISAVLSTPAGSGVTYTGVPVPDDERVAARQILRNTSGQTLVFYVDVETNDLTSTTFSSTKTDAELATGTYQLLLDEDNRDLSTLYDPPPADKAVIAHNQDRLFLAGEEPYAEGCVAVTQGSRTVAGVGTEWPATFAGRYLWVNGSDQPYAIESVADAQTLTLADAYAAPTDPYASYQVRPALAQRRLVAFSEAGLPEAWPPTNAVSVPEDGDEVTALMPFDSFLFVFERRHAYRLTFNEGPLKDGALFLSAGRGCINSRCWVVADEAAYLLDEQGVYAYQGSQTEAVSEPIQDLFQAGPSRPAYRVQWAASRWFHSCYDPGTQTARFFVTLAGQGVPRHALCFEVRQKRWWVEEYPFPVGASCVATYQGRRRVFVGGPGGRVYLLGAGGLDGPDETRGTVRGAVTSATPTSLSDSSASFGDDLVNAAVTITAGKGKRQRRKIVSVSGTTLRVDLPWLDAPDSTSTYQIGGVQWRYRTGWFRWAAAEQEGARRLEVVFEPVAQDATLDARLYRDRSREPVVWDHTQSVEEGDGFGSEQGQADLTGDLTKPAGLIQKRLDGHKDFYSDGPRFVSVGLDGVANAERVELVQLSLDGAVGAE